MKYFYLAQELVIGIESVNSDTKIYLRSM